MVYSIPDPHAAFEEPVANNDAEFATTGPLYKFLSLKSLSTTTCASLPLSRACFMMGTRAFRRSWTSFGYF